MIEDVSAEMQEQLKKESILERFVTVEEIFNTVKFFIQTPYVTGQTIHLNGGLYYG